MKRVKRLLKAGVISALACMVKADSAILTDQTKELLARYTCLMQTHTEARSGISSTEAA